MESPFPLPTDIPAKSDSPEKTAARLEDLLDGEAAVLRRESWNKLVPLQRQIARFWTRLANHPAYLQSPDGQAALTRIRRRVEENAARLKTLTQEVRDRLDRERRLGRARRAYGGSSS